MDSGGRGVARTHIEVVVVAAEQLEVGFAGGAVEGVAIFVVVETGRDEVPVLEVLANDRVDLFLLELARPLELVVVLIGARR
jgi:hypothetical protein